MLQGVVLVDKPAGITSHDVVSRLRQRLGTKKIGHAGTLDPMATGLLLLGVNAGTKLLTYFVGMPKQYRATIRLGQSTTTDDAEGQVLQSFDVSNLDVGKIITAMEQFCGPIMQVPSSVSAIKVAGKRAYDIVRKGGDVSLSARQIEISKFELLTPVRISNSWIDLDVLVDCSSGTYIRAIARDLGAALGVGGHLTALRRTEVGKFRVSEASTLDCDLSVISMEATAMGLFPLVSVDSDIAEQLVHGKRPKFLIAGVTGILFKEQLLAVCEPHEGGMRSQLVFPEVFHG